MGKSMIRLYHGSENIIKQPLFGKGSSRNDYGKGFYCTENMELAKEWACSKGSDGFANVYDLDMAGLNVLKLNKPPYNVLNWLAILAENRTYWERNSISEDAKNYLKENFLIDIAGYDVIVGYRADDSYFSFARNFVSNAITLPQLQEAMRLGKLGEQMVLKSEQAFRQIRFLEAKPAAANEYYAKKAARDRAAQKEYRSRVRSQSHTNELLMIDIMREGIKDGDERLF